MSVETTIKQFIRCLTEKNYAEANKYLQQAVTEKIRQKIKTAVVTQKLF